MAQPDRRHPARTAPAPEVTGPVPAGRPAPAPTPVGTPAVTGAAIPAPAPIPARTRRAAIQRVDLWSLAKIAVAFYLATVAVAVVALITLWFIAEAAGIVDNLENFIADLLAYQDFRFLSFVMLRAVVVLGLVWVALATTLTVIAGAFYNLFSDLVGGVEITVTDLPQEG